MESERKRTHSSLPTRAVAQKTEKKKKKKREPKSRKDSFYSNSVDATYAKSQMQTSQRVGGLAHGENHNTVWLPTVRFKQEFPGPVRT